MANALSERYTTRVICFILDSALFGANRDFVYVDSQALCEAQSVENTLTRDDMRWRVLVLPAADTLPLEAWKNLVTF